VKYFIDKENEIHENKEIIETLLFDTEQELNTIINDLND